MKLPLAIALIVLLSTSSFAAKPVKGPGKPDKPQKIHDRDRDGYGSDVDCDDRNQYINPGAQEIFFNGIDENCNGMEDDIYIDPNDDDNDLDGFSINNGDCDDTNPSINPNAVEILDNGIDENCNGMYDDVILPEEVTYHLTWDASPTPEVEGYIVYQDDLAPFILGNFYEYYATFMKLPTDENCFYVIAYKGEQESPPSNTVCK